MTLRLLFTLTRDAMSAATGADHAITPIAPRFHRAYLRDGATLMPLRISARWLPLYAFSDTRVSLLRHYYFSFHYHDTPRAPSYMPPLRWGHIGDIDAIYAIT